VKRDAIPILILVGIIALLFADVLFLGSGFYFRDVLRDYLPARFVVREALLGGELPRWNRWWSGGQPLAANPGFQLFYPGTWLVLLPFPFGFHLEVVAHIALAAIGMFVLVRALAGTREAAFFAAISFALGSAVLSLTNLIPFLTSIAWWPWIATFALKRRFRPLALSVAMLLLAGEVSMILMTAILLLALLRRDSWKTIVAAGAVAIAIASVQLVPSADLARDSGRAHAFSYEDATAWTMPAGRPLELIWPAAFGRVTDDGLEFRGSHRYRPPRIPLIVSIYCGALAPMLAIAGIVARVRGWIVAASLAAISYVLATTPLLYRIGIRSIRYPEKFVLLGLFAMVVLAGVAFDRIRPRWRLAVLGLALIDVGMRVNQVAPRMPRAFFDPPPLAVALRHEPRVWNQAYVSPKLRIPPAPATYWTERNALFPFSGAMWGVRTVYEEDINLTNLQPTYKVMETLWKAQSPLPFLQAAGASAAIVADPSGGVRVVHIPTLPLARLRGGMGQVLTFAETANTITIRVNARAPAFLDVAVTPHKYWHATIDGRAAPLQVANIAYQGIVVPAGAHTIELRYRNPLVLIFGIVSIVAFVLVLGAPVILYH